MIAADRAVADVHGPRAVRLIDDAIARFELDLSSLTVLTEAATGAFAVTAVIAARAGAARVLALARESPYGSVADARAAVAALARLAGVPRTTIEVLDELSTDVISAADVVTNLGSVRPIDATFARSLKPTAAVSLMCEAWEWRPGDLDLDACRARGAVVIATDESANGAGVFDHCGTLAVRLVLDADVEVLRSAIVVVGGDEFARVAAAALTRSGAHVTLATDLRDESVRAAVSRADALVVADYLATDDVVGDNASSTMAPDELARLAPTITVVQLAGPIDADALVRRGIRCIPAVRLPPRRMSRTLAYLGPRPVIDLHCAGLRVGELATRARLSGLSPDDVVDRVIRRTSLAQRIDVGHREAHASP